MNFIPFSLMEGMMWNLLQISESLNHNSINELNIEICELKNQTFGVI